MSALSCANQPAVMLHCQRWPALSDSASAPELVLWHGWGGDSGIFAEWLPRLRAHCHVTAFDLPGYGVSVALPWLTLPALFDAVVAQMPARAIHLGFSLGGMLALQFARHCPQRVQALITVASNACFVEAAGWPTAMPVEDFRAFSNALTEGSASTLQRFALLQARGADDEKRQQKLLRQCAAQLVANADVLIESLQTLALLDNRQVLTELEVPLLALFGAQDRLVPAASAAQIGALPQRAARTAQVVEGAAHLPFLSHAKACTAAIANFLAGQGLLPSEQACERQLNKARVARSFSRAATTYDAVATLQREVGVELLARLPAVRGIALDIGCGTGALTDQLSGDVVIGLDLAEGMLRYARQFHREHAIHYLAGDAEQLPLADDSIDTVFSSLALQWCEDQPGLFAEIARVLKPGGRALLATLGPDTLHELRAAWRSVDDFVHVNRFAARPVLEQAIVAAGLQLQSFDEQSKVLRYAQLRELTAELKALGAHNVNAGAPRGLTGRQRALAFREAYEQQRDADGLLPASYQVWFLCLAKPTIINTAQ